MFNCQVNQINNGFLIATPGSQDRITGAITEPGAVYCADWETVIETLKELNPETESKISTLDR